MDYRELKNFGVPMNRSMREAERLLDARLRRKAFRVVLKRLGIINTLRLLLSLGKERARMAEAVPSLVGLNGLQDEYFITMLLERTAFFSAMARLVGKDKALDVHKEITDFIGPAINRIVFPPTDEIERFSDPFDVFRKYVLSMMEADRREGIHEFNVVEDSDKAFAMDVTYCAFAEIPNRLGIPEACLPNCYSDDVFLPDYLRPLGVRFVRTGTIARGDFQCDFRFERIEDM
jgi:hypothetical protein